MDAAPQPVPYRRIGTILVEKALITADQLAYALAEQKETGRPLGEICVERFRLDRLSLADALAEQWEEMQRAERSLDQVTTPGADLDGTGDDEGPELSAEDELRILLEEAQAARTELTVKTDELSRRLAALEALVVGVSDALAELRPGDKTSTDDPRSGHGVAPVGARPKRARSGARSTARRAATS